MRLQQARHRRHTSHVLLISVTILYSECYGKRVAQQQAVLTRVGNCAGPRDSDAGGGLVKRRRCKHRNKNMLLREKILSLSNHRWLYCPDQSYLQAVVNSRGVMAVLGDYPAEGIHIRDGNPSCACMGDFCANHLSFPIRNPKR